MMRSSLSERLASAPQVLLHYFWIFLFPKEITLTQDWIVKEFNWAEFFFPLLILILLFTLMFKALSKERRTLFFGAWGLLGLLFHAQIFPLDGTVSDRWFYFPMIGFLSGTGLFFFNLKNSFYSKFWKTFNLALPALLLLAVPLSVRSFYRSQDWETPYKLFFHDAQVIPDTFYLQNNVGLELFREKQYREAIPYFQKTIQLTAPGSDSEFSAWKNLGAVYLELHEWKHAEEAFQKAMENSNDPLAYYGYALTLHQKGDLVGKKIFLEKIAFPRFPKHPLLMQLRSD
jgi:tetratricopeptide (TPR) repeat protein